MIKEGTQEAEVKSKLRLQALEKGFDLKIKKIQSHYSSSIKVFIRSLLNLSFCFRSERS